MPNGSAQLRPDLNQPVEISDSFGISQQLIQAQLERILSSALFINSERLRRFLQYAVQQVAQGQPGQLKEYSLGVSVFDKRDSFDPRFDPIVRVEAGRLRTRLKQYYDTEGRDDPLVIDLPKGSYVPRFEPASSSRLAPLATPPAFVERRSQSQSRSAIAVLPFSDHSPHRDQEYFCDGMTRGTDQRPHKDPGAARGRVAIGTEIARQNSRHSFHCRATQSRHGASRERAQSR